jgi:hypothetical protein
MRSSLLEDAAAGQVSWLPGGEATLSVARPAPAAFPGEAPSGSAVAM